MEAARFVSLSKAATILGVSHRSLLNWIAEGVIPAYRPTEKGSFLIVIAEVEEAIKRRTTQRAESFTKERFNAIIDKVKAEIADARKFRVEKVTPVKKAKAPVLRHGETVH